MGKALKEIIRGYHVFLPKGWKRAAIYMVSLFLIMGICILAGPDLPAGVFVLLFPGTCILWADGIIYYLIFGGYADKDSKHMEYIKSSDRGVRLYHRALVADAARRFGSISLIFLTVLIMILNQHSLDTQMVFFLVGAFSVTCLMAFAASFIMGFLQNILWAFLTLGILDAVYCIAIILFSVAVTIGLHAGLLAAIILLAGGLAFLLIRGQIAFLVKRMEGWYYDI